MNIEIDIPRPFLTLSILAVFASGVYVGGGTQKLASLLPFSGSSAVSVTDTGATSTDVAPAVGGDTTPKQEKISKAEEDVRLARSQREVLARKADILRGELHVLAAEREALGGQIDPQLEKQFSDSTQILNALLQDQKRSEQFLLASLNQIWEAQGRAMALGTTDDGTTMPTLVWPVQPKLGLSATFHDPNYEARFGLRHDAIDIPTPQLTIVKAAADGVVKDVVDHGLGFNYITVKHGGGLVTLYGHITQFIAQPGDIVHAGDPIGYSGGRPGTPGAGLSTGPHLHFGVFKNGVAVDPQQYLPAYEGTPTTADDATTDTGSAMSVR